MGEKVVRRRLADGTVKTYRYPRGGKRILPSSLGALIQEYRASPEFKRLRPATRTAYLSAIGRMEDLYRVAIDDLRRRHVIRLRDRFADMPATANMVLTTFSAVMTYAVQLEYRESNPARGVSRLETGEYRRWTDAEIAFACAGFQERLRRVIVLALYTGQRVGDLAAMRWSDFDGEGIQVTQQKTGTKLWIACHAALKAELLAWKEMGRTATTILVDSRGRPYRGAYLSTAMSAEIAEYPELKGCVLHGLRKTAAARLAEAGCSTHEIAAVTGHLSLSMLQHYTVEADQRTRARAAVIKLENAGGKRDKDRG